ncbi:MAG: hypothetical protein DLM72_06660 [Candidatus Nitrosopolaris wilkensis]|nr:MAG: hypothetical protein DLM72_06660 [Candidatus Nitrosopolaris wilkensis]
MACDAIIIACASLVVSPANTCLYTLKRLKLP